MTTPESATESARELAIFISYRRSLSRADAGRLYDALSRRFGRASVFMDVDNLRPGQDWAEAIDAAVSNASVVLVLIGKDWAAAADEQGRRRLDDPSDPVRLEIEAALQHRKQIIPILFEQADLPAEEELPESIRPLRRRQVQRISHATFQGDISPLVRTLRAMKERNIAASQADRPVTASSTRGSARTTNGGIASGSRRLAFGAAGVGLAAVAVFVMFPYVRDFLVGSASSSPSPVGESTTRLAWIEGDGTDGALYTRDFNGITPVGPDRRWDAQGNEPAWDPSGEFVVLANADPERPERRNTLLVVDAQPPGTLLHEVEIESLAEIGDPTWAPDGHALAFWGTTESGGAQNIYIATHPDFAGLLSGSPDAPIGGLDVCSIASVDEAFPRSHPAWSFSSSRLAFYQREDDIMVVDAECEAVPEPFNASTGIETWESLSWQAGDESLVGGATVPDTNEYQLWSIQPDGSQPRELDPRAGEWHYGVALSEKHMAYVVDDSSYYSLWIVDVVTNEQTRVREQHNIRLDSPSLVEIPEV